MQSNNKKKIKILFVGDLRSHTRSYFRFCVLKDLGCIVDGVSFNYEGAIKRNLLKAIYLKVFDAIGYPYDYTSLNQRIRNVAGSDYKIIWVEKSLMLHYSVLAWIKKVNKDAKVISFTEDDMYAKHNQSAYYRNCLSLYDLVVTTKSYNANADELPSLGAKKVIFVNKTYYEKMHRPIAVTDDDRSRYGADVGFIGTFEKERAESILFLANKGVRVRVWGTGWHKYQKKNENIILENRPIYGDEYVKAINATKINLCFLRKKNRDLQTDRTMEIPACASFMLAERTKEQLELFEENKEVVYFSDNNELLEKIMYYLKRDEERKNIAENARKACEYKKYDFTDQMRNLLKLISGTDVGHS